MQERDVVLRKLAELGQDLRIAAGVVGVDAGDLLGVVGRPGVGVFPAAAHADERGLFGQAVFVGEKLIPGVPLLAGLERGVGGDIGDVKTAPQQFDLGLRLMVPVATLPGPGVSGRGGFRDDDDAAPLAFSGIADAEALAVGRFERRDRQSLFVHHEIVPIKAVMPGGLLAFERRSGIGGQHIARENDGKKKAEWECENSIHLSVLPRFLQTNPTRTTQQIRIVNPPSMENVSPVT